MGSRSGLHGMVNSPDEKPKITRSLLKRVLFYAGPYRWLMVGMLLLILASTGLGLLSPLIMRDLIDHAIPSRDVHRLILLALAMLGIPIVNGALNVVQRRINARVGEGVICDLRQALYAGLQGR
jgi:ATP-binding cassette, subfamily B, bacterial